jgi:hypothetical protein
MERLSRITVPHHGGFPLIGDTHSLDIGDRMAQACEGFCGFFDAGLYGLHNLFWIMLMLSADGSAIQSHAAKATFAGSPTLIADNTA